MSGGRVGEGEVTVIDDAEEALAVVDRTQPPAVGRLFPVSIHVPDSITKNPENSTVR